MKLANRVVALSLFLLTAAFPAWAQRIDDGPLQVYWALIEPIKQGDSLRVADWTRFLKIEANEAYINNQGFGAKYLANLRRAVEVVYQPQQAALLRERLKDPVKNWLTYKVYQYKAHEPELKAYQARLKQPEYQEAMYQTAWAWLPKRLQQRDTAAIIYLLGIENDAIAGNHLMILTLWSAYNQDKLLNGTLIGHELHHNLRQPVAFQNVTEQDKGIIYALNSVLNEGSADMIDKPVALQHEAELPMEFQRSEFLLHQADSIVRVLDQRLAAMARSNGAEAQPEKYYRTLIRWTSGHCPGYYMTDIIVRNGLRRALLKQVQNPFAFIYLYNKAARKDQAKPPVFSEAAIQYVRQLEKKYWPTKAKA
ncbi:DUF5700 domain-containing putative Zn-dependent protease [Hymenobacter sp. CRA2]|uniref:DUF5700 domain-containing putative Zn-dependent protease n=1 Tax=Hymenobacter sp. CRA2 TaxID=1955620 RepID=UPI00098F722D|nr:DUF5700 domain-containing putative Zn-dependent protease [Hymenobacter sp. CRA2]OON68847.1 hypothetical protein B0919_11785 [Hymenobacter sp. CRA2]